MSRGQRMLSEVESLPLTPERWPDLVDLFGERGMGRLLVHVVAPPRRGIRAAPGRRDEATPAGSRGHGPTPGDPRLCRGGSGGMVRDRAAGGVHPPLVLPAAPQGPRPGGRCAGLVGRLLLRPAPSVTLGGGERGAQWLTWRESTRRVGERDRPPMLTFTEPTGDGRGMERRVLFEGDVGFAFSRRPSSRGWSPRGFPPTPRTRSGVGRGPSWPRRPGTASPHGSSPSPALGLPCRRATGSSRTRCTTSCATRCGRRTTSDGASCGEPSPAATCP